MRDVDKYIRWDDKLRKFVPLWYRRAILPTWMYFDAPTANPLIIPAVGAAVNPPYNQKYWDVDGQSGGMGSPFVCESMVFADSTDTTALANFTVSLQEIGDAKQFMNVPIHIRNIAGTAQTPGRFRETYYFPSQHTIMATFAKIGGGAVNARMYLAGRQYYPWMPDLLAYPEEKQKLINLLKRWTERRKYVSPFWYAPDGTPITLGAGATTTIQARIGDDSHFEMLAMTAVATGNFALEITEVKTKQTISNGQFTQTNGIGTALFPAFFPVGYIVPAGHRLIFRFTDLTGAPNIVNLCIQGRRWYCPFVDIKSVDQDTKMPIVEEVEQIPVGAESEPEHQSVGIELFEDE